MQTSPGHGRRRPSGANFSGSKYPRRRQTARRPNPRMPARHQRTVGRRLPWRPESVQRHPSAAAGRRRRRACEMRAVGLRRKPPIGRQPRCNIATTSATNAACAAERRNKSIQPPASLARSNRKPCRSARRGHRLGSEVIAPDDLKITRLNARRQTSGSFV